MAKSDVQTLLGAVRRRLWREQFVAALRLALWASAGLMLLAVAVHLAARRVPVDAVLLAIAGAWVSMLVRAAWRRPSDSACALWADRHLGGASAFTTLLEMGKGTQGFANAPALKWLEHWATARVPDGLRRLEERREPQRLARPLLSMLVCTALATLVLTLPDLAPAPRQQAAATSMSGIGDRPTPNAEPPASAELASQIASALRSTESPTASERRDAGRAQAAGPGKANDGNAPPPTQPGAAPPGELATAGSSPSGTPVVAARKVGTTPAAGTGAGRDAGDGRDERAEVGVSRALRGTIAVQRSESRARPASTERQADTDQSATYDEGLSMHGAATQQADPAAAAATPPSATESARLSPTEKSYVQAWMKASGRQR